MDGSTVGSWITLTFIRFLLPFFTSVPNYPPKNHNCHNIGEYQFYKTHYLISPSFFAIKSFPPARIRPEVRSLELKIKLYGFITNRTTLLIANRTDIAFLERTFGPRASNHCYRLLWLLPHQMTVLGLTHGLLPTFNLFIRLQHSSSSLFGILSDLQSCGT